MDVRSNTKDMVLVLTLALTLTHLPYSHSLPHICNFKATSSSSYAVENGLPFCSLPADELPSGRAIPGSSVRATPFPPWINMTLVGQGQKFAAKNKYALIHTSLVGLLIGLPMPDAFNVLAFTSRSDSPERAIRRYLATAAQFLVWLESQPEPNLDPTQNAILTSIRHVREHHITVAQRANAAPKPMVDPHKYDAIPTDDNMWSVVQDDFADSELPYQDWPPWYSQYDTSATAINQFAQGLTLVQFIGYAIINPETVFIWDATEDELTAYLHLWAVLGWMLGVDDDYNTCLQPDPQTAAAYFTDLFEKYMYPGFYHVSKFPRILIESFQKNFGQFFPNQYGMRCLLYQYLTRHVKIPMHHFYSILSPTDKLLVYEYDNVVVPSTQLESTRNANNQAARSIVAVGILGYFGPYFTNWQWAEYVFYPLVEPTREQQKCESERKREMNKF